MMLERCGAEVTEIRRPLDPADTTTAGLMALDGIVIPGGESTVIGKLMKEWGLFDALITCGKAGMPIYGSRAGLILLCRDIEGPEGEPLDQLRLGLLDARARRNAFGRQLDSFETKLDVKGIAPDLEAVFIRAPLIAEVAPGVEVLASVPAGSKAYPVAVRQGRIMATSFHPELTADRRFHEAFLKLCREWREERSGLAESGLSS
jgi:5'-phosphate synthase pdxT subunit